MIEEITLNLFDYGILQFGRFADDNEIVPINITLGMLVSYPILLCQLADEVAQRILPSAKYRLVTSLESFAVALVVSQRLNIPLVYQQQVTTSAVSDFVGAYDIGHPTCAIWSREWLQGLEHFKKRSTSVGLHVERVLTIVGMTNTHNVILPLDSILEILVAHQRIKAIQHDTVLNWIATKTAL